MFGGYRGRHPRTLPSVLDAFFDASKLLCPLRVIVNILFGMMVRPSRCVACWNYRCISLTFIATTPKSYFSLFFVGGSTVVQPWARHTSQMLRTISKKKIKKKNDRDRKANP